MPEPETNGNKPPEEAARPPELPTSSYGSLGKTSEEAVIPTEGEKSAADPAPESALKPAKTGKTALEGSPKCEGKNEKEEPPVDSKEAPYDIPMESLKENKSNPSTEASKAKSDDMREETKESADAVPSEDPTKLEESAGDSAPKDQNIGRLVELTKVLPTGQIVPLPGEVVAFQEQDGRFPPRYSVQWSSSTEANAVVVEDDWMVTDFDTLISGGELQSALNRVHERFTQHVELELESNPLVSKLLLYAAMEEALQTNLQIQQQRHQVSGEPQKLMGSKQDSHPPLYYSTSPSSYLKAPTATDTMPTDVEAKVYMTPSSLAQRVRQGCQWAHRYLMAQQPAPPPAPVPLISSSNQRRSLRQPKPLPPPSVPKPTPVQQGGRVAMWWLDQLEQIANGEEEIKQEGAEKKPEAMEEDPEDSGTKLKTEPSSKPKPVKNGNAKKEKATPMDADNADDDDDEEEEESNKQDDDEDYGSKDADLEDEEDHELEDVEKERGKLSPVPDESVEDEEADNVEEEDEDADVEESEEDLQQAIMHQNPYLKPNFASLLEYLARPKALTGEEVQKAMTDIILRIKFNKRSSNVGLETNSLITVDQLVLDQETPNYPPGKVVLKCVSDESFSELQKMEAQAFSRCKFALDVIGDEESNMQIQRKQELIMQEIQFKEEKAWAKWRHKGIHEGFAAWPSWHSAIAEWVKANVAAYDPSAVAASAISNPETSQDDEALAKSLDEAEGGGRRRKARRAAAGAADGVFYGNQSQLTQKQLQDALIRLVKTNQFQTLLKLQALVADDSTDPVRRCRVALGKLVWKRNLLLRRPMDSSLSDSSIALSTQKTPLLSMPLPVDDDGEESQATNPKEVSAEETVLINYIQVLHQTELHLRRLVTKNLAEIPVAIIATAADERPGSLEAMDTADFEDTTAFEWHTTGHDLLKRTIFRPASPDGNSTDLTPCFWYEIQDFSQSIESAADDKDDPEAKQRRMRFRAVPVPPPGESWAEQEEILLLTEAQVHAGVKAAELEKKNRSNTVSDGNPFSGASGDKVTLIPVDVDEAGEQVSDIHGRIVGYDNIVLEDDDDVEYRILVLPESGDSKEAFWASLDVRADTASYVCQPIGSSNVWYSIEQFDYHQGSDAHQQCEFVLNWLGRQNKAAPFAEPVDPVALNIPTYPQIIKNPMDISTMAEKLESGQYSSILPGQTVGISPISRMLNGPFRKDIELIFDNAMRFNPPDDWIYQAAAQLKKSALKKIADLSSAADLKVSGVGRFRQKRSVYIDEDSDVDMYEYESDNDDDFGGRKSKKRKRPARGGAQKDEFAARAIEHPIRLQNTLRDASNLKGPFANLPINLSASSYSLPPQWNCRLSTGAAFKVEAEEDGVSNKMAQEMAELLELQKVVEANESAGLRRSTRAQDIPSSTNSRGSNKSKGAPSIEYFVKDLTGSDKVDMKTLPSTRSEVEVQAEKLHESYYSKLYQSYSKAIGTSESNAEAFGVYSNGSFPPYMGRVIPVSGWDEVSWEIRSPFVVPALRWVLRGLIQSGHLTALEQMNADFSSGVILTNDIYYWDPNLQPFETLDLRDLQRKKRANQAGEEESEDEVELSEYEKARAERVARNAERLRALGLA